MVVKKASRCKTLKIIFPGLTKLLYILNPVNVSMILHSYHPYLLTHPSSLSTPYDLSLSTKWSVMLKGNTKLKRTQSSLTLTNGLQ